MPTAPANVKMHGTFNTSSLSTVQSALSGLSLRPCRRCSNSLHGAAEVTGTTLWPGPLFARCHVQINGHASGYKIPSPPQAVSSPPLYSLLQFFSSASTHFSATMSYGSPPHDQNGYPYQYPQPNQNYATPVGWGFAQPGWETPSANPPGGAFPGGWCAPEQYSPASMWDQSGPPHSPQWGGGVRICSLIFSAYQRALTTVQRPTGA